MRALIAGTIFALLVATPLSAKPSAPGCLDRSAAQQQITWERKENGAYEMARSNLCCCTNTFGSMCCAYVSFCGGFVPGCLCV